MTTYAVDGASGILQRRGIVEVGRGRKDDVPLSGYVVNLRSLYRVNSPCCFGIRLPRCGCWATLVKADNIKVEKRRTQRSVDHGWPASWPRLSGLNTTRVCWLSQLSVRALERLSVTLSFVLYVNKYQSSPSAEYLVTWPPGVSHLNVRSGVCNTQCIPPRQRSV